MSVLSFPRLYFTGLISWDPGLTNNSTDVYDSADVRLILPQGVTFDTFKQWVIDNDFSNWNYYGTHTCQFDPEKTLITGGALSPGTVITNDAVVGKQLQLTGKLVDLDPASIFTSQIYFEQFGFGDSQAGARADRTHRMHSRWINFRRSFAGLDIAGNAAVVWQTAFEREHLQLQNSSNSALLKALQDAIAQNGARGLMVRFCTYRTLYFQNGVLNTIPQQPKNMQELHDLYKQGLIFSNPAYSLVAGSIGVWKDGECATVPGGRYLAPANAVTTVANQGPVRLGPCVAQVDREHNVLSLDLNSTIPEVDADVNKADYGTLTVGVVQGNTIDPIATIDSSSYARAAYESTAGIIDIPIDSAQADKLDAGQLVLQVQQDGEAVVAMVEIELVAQTDDRDTYLNQASPRSVTIQVTQKGKTAPAGTQVMVARYDRSGRALAASVAPPQVLPVGTDGSVSLNLTPQAPGFISFGLLPFAQGAPQPPIPQRLDIMAAFFLSVRTLPFDDQLAAQTPDSQLSWTFIFENILRLYDLLNPVMASPEIGLALNDKSIWTTPSKAFLLKRVTGDDSFENFNHMPVTRELSTGKQKLLHRFCDLVINGGLPPDDAVESEAVSEPPLIPDFDFRRSR